MGNWDVMEICWWDMINVFCCLIIVILFGDLDCLWEGLLIWYQIIVWVYNYIEYVKISYKVIQEIIKEFLELDEVVMVLLVLKLDYIIFSS